MNDTWRAISSEAALAAEHLGIGVTALGRANYAERAHYPEAFFALSVGFERSAKLALVVDHAMQNGGSFPDEKAYRKYGHDLQKLLKALDAIAARATGDDAFQRPESEIHLAILAVLTDFATNVTRYYNLDVLAGTSAPEDPIAAWNRRVTQPVLKAHDKKRSRERRERNARAAEALTGGFALVRFEHESGEPLDSVEAASLRTGETEFARPWERMYVLQLARFISRVMRQLYGGTGDIPFLNEFFYLFDQDDAYLRSRKTWSIYRP